MKYRTRKRSIVEYKVDGKNILLYQEDFDLEQTLDCGQAFRWTKTENGYRGYYLNKPLEIQKENDSFVLLDTSEEDFVQIWKYYFDLETDYTKLKMAYSKDSTLKNACEFASGIRLLRQDSWEALCSFIISQNNNIPRIKGIISRLCEHFGGFPSANQLATYTPDDLQFLRAGFRAKYISDAANKVANGEIDFKKIKEMEINDARKSMMTIKGVGPKVAECALLYGMYRVEAFPIDVWIKRVMEQYYPGGFPQEFAENAGIAQQYLFHYIRNLEK